MLSCWSAVAGQHGDIVVIRAQIEQSVQCIRSSGPRPNQLLPYMLLAGLWTSPLSFRLVLNILFVFRVTAVSSGLPFFNHKEINTNLLSFHPSNQSVSERCG